jgi:intein/homing endonuclease
MKQNRLTLEQKEELFDMYKTYQYTYKQLSEYFEKSINSIACLLNREGLVGKRKNNHFRKYPINQNYFDEIDTEEKAYFLGLLCADGCNHKNSTKVSMWLKESDKEILEKFKNVLQPTKPLTYCKKKIGNNQYGIQISNRKISDRLNELGCVPNKTTLLRFPTQIPDELLKHYLRGFFDGDGWLGNKETSVTSTPQFCAGLQKFLLDKFNLESKKRLKNGAIELRMSVKTSKIFLNWVYKDASVYLERKYQKYLKYYAS